MSSITVHQALHGYQDGHQLISASVDLDRAEAATMQIMSDLSGPAFQRGFETYLTAYPLLNAGLFCLARTWFAPERPRPGCVWTHSLLVDLEDLAGISDIRILFGAFRQPDEASPSFETYQTRIPVAVARLDPPVISLSVATEVMRGIYKSQARVVVPSDNAQAYETLVAAIFSQQWPRLRRNFRFCTGALSLRDMDFDISISPPTVTQGVGKGTKVLSLSRASSDPVEESWLPAAANDLIEATPSAMRSFLWRYGSQFQDGRAVYSSLISVFQTITSADNSPETLISTLAHFFPEESSANLLKSELLGKSSKFGTGVGEARLLRALIAHPLAGAIPEAGLAVKVRAQHLSQSDFESASELAELAMQLEGRHAFAFLEGYLDHCQTSTDLLSTAPLGTLLRIFERDPSIAWLAPFWLRPSNDQISLAYRVSRGTIDLPNVISAVLKAGAFPALEVFIRNLAVPALEAFLSLLEASGEGIVTATPEMKRVLQAHASELPSLVAGGHLNGPGLLVVAAVLDPRSRATRSAGANPWIAAIRGKYRLSRLEDDISARVFFVTLGLASDDDSGLQLIAGSFSDVISALDSGALSSSLWWAIEPSLPWSYTLSRRQRLIRAPLQIMIDRGASPSAFASIFPTALLAQDARRELNRMWGGTGLQTRISQAIQAGQLNEWGGASLFESDS